MQYKHLGIEHHERLHWQVDLKIGLRQFNLKALKAQQESCAQSCLASLESPINVALAFRMHDMCVRAVQLYGSAVWGMQYLSSDPARVAHNLLEGGHLGFMWRWCRLRANVPVWAIYKELGRLTVQDTTCCPAWCTRCDCKSLTCMTPGASMTICHKYAGQVVIT